MSSNVKLVFRQNTAKGAPLVKLSDDINRKSKIEILIRILDFEGC